MNVAITFTNYSHRDLYLRNLLKQLKKATLNPVIFDSAVNETVLSFQKYRVVREKKKTLFENIHSAFLFLADQEGKCLYLQEDCQLCKSFRKRLNKIKVDGSTLYLLYSTSRNNNIPIGNFYGEVALLANDSFFKLYRSFWEGKTITHKTKHDLGLRRFLKTNKISIVNIIPNLVQHIGTHSAKKRKYCSLDSMLRSPTFKS